MKTAILPQVRVEPELRTDLEAVLRPGETLSEFVESTVRSAIAYRREQTEFLARGNAAWQAYQHDSIAHPAAQVVQELRELLDAQRQRLSPRHDTPAR